MMKGAANQSWLKTLSLLQMKVRLKPTGGAGVRSDEVLILDSLSASLTLTDPDVADDGLALEEDGRDV